MGDIAVISENRNSLYGLDRNKHARDIRTKLTNSNVLRAGEYNFDQQKEKNDIWKTSSSIDYTCQNPLVVPENKVVMHGPSKGRGQLNKHFEFGNSQDVPDSQVYSQSLSKDDYVDKGRVKPDIMSENRVVNWPDMAPQLAVDRSIGRSEYNFSFLDKALPNLSPDFPRVSASKTIFPYKDTKAQANKKVNVSLGSDLNEYVSDSKRSYMSPSSVRGHNTTLLDMVKDSTGVSEKMLNMARNSNVFRRGDYNNAKQSTGTTFTVDYCKRQYNPSTVPVLPKGDHDLADVVNDDNPQNADRPPMPQMIGKFLKDDLEGVYSDADKGKSDQTQAHFLFGSDDTVQRSMYKKDYGQDTRAKHSKVTFCLPPKNSEVLAFDPALNKTGDTTTRNAHSAGTFPMAIPANELQRMRLKNNLGKRYGTNVVIAPDVNNHAGDRKISMAHESFGPPPSDFQAMSPRKTDHKRYNYIEANVSLPFKVSPEKSSEAQNQFRPVGMDAESSILRQKSADAANKTMKEWVRSTHFINGYVPMSFHTENRDLFAGRQSEVVDKPAAGKIEVKTPFEFPHHAHSKNTLDTQPEPGSRSQRVGMPSRAFPSLPTHKASVTANDYPPLERRSFTTTQLKMMQQDNKLVGKPIAASHLFHTDTSGGKNMVSTAMSDYIKPELMVGTPRNMTSIQ